MLSYLGVWSLELFSPTFFSTSSKKKRKKISVNRAHLTNKSYFISRSFILIFVGLFYIEGTKYLTFRQYIPIALTITRETYKVVNHQTRPAPGGTVNFGYHKS